MKNECSLYRKVKTSDLHAVLWKPLWSRANLEKGLIYLESLEIIESEFLLVYSKWCLHNWRNKLSPKYWIFILLKCYAELGKICRIPESVASGNYVPQNCPAPSLFFYLFRMSFKRPKNCWHSIDWTLGTIPWHRILNWEARNGSASENYVPRNVPQCPAVMKNH